MSFDFSHLTDPGPGGVYFHIPAKSRNQAYLAYRIKGDATTSEWQAFQQTFNHPYYYSYDKGAIGLVIPFAEEVPTKYLLHDFDWESDALVRLSFGADYRQRPSQNQPTPHFVLANDGLDYVDIIGLSGEGLTLNPKKLIDGVKAFVQTKSYHDLTQDDLAYRQFLQSLANDQLNNMLSAKDVAKILVILHPQRANVDDEYKQAQQDLQSSSGLRTKTKPFGQYLNLYQSPGDHPADNIGQHLLSMLSNNFEPSEKFKMSQVVNLITEVYSPYLIKDGGTDAQNVVIFDPTKGAWVHDENDFSTLLYMIRGVSKAADLNSLLMSLGAKAKSLNHYIQPYRDSRYLLFKNCVLDVKTMQQLPLDDPKVKELQFTVRHRIEINYDPTIQSAPVFPGERVDGGDWNPFDFFLAYANDDLEKLQFLFFCLSLGLFAGHNFKANLSIRGESGWGKSSLMNIYEGLFPGRVFTTSFPHFNQQFGFTNYNANTSVIWITECNTDTAPLNDDIGITTYDNFCDNNIKLQVKNSSDLIIQDPPQMYVDGTSFIRARNMDTGPMRRTFVFDLPNRDTDGSKRIKDLLTKAYANDITKLLRDETVLQWLVNQMIYAYRDPDHEIFNLANNERRWSLELNFSEGNESLLALPTFAKNWRGLMTGTDGDVQDWFDDEFAPYFSKDNDNPQMMHDDLAYAFYLDSYQQKYRSQDPNSNQAMSRSAFTKKFRYLLQQAHWVTEWPRDPKDGNKHRRTQVRNLSGTSFDIANYQADGYPVPDHLSDEAINDTKRNDNYPLGSRNRGWYYLHYDDQGISLGD